MSAAIIQQPKSNSQLVDPLTRIERQELKEHERTIDRGKRSFVEVGQALAAIREKRLYREKYPDFQSYCQSTLGIGASRGRQLIGASHVTRLLEAVTNVTPENEAIARELVPFIGPRLEALWTAVIAAAPMKADGTPHVTARYIKKITRAVNEVACKSSAYQQLNTALTRSSMNIATELKADLLDQILERIEEGCYTIAAIIKCDECGKDRFGLSNDDIKRYIDELVEQGKVEWRPQGGRKEDQPGEMPLICVPVGTPAGR